MTARYIPRMVSLRNVALVSVLATVAAAGCESKKPEGLPPAPDWSGTGAPSAAQLGAVPAPSGGGGDPHAGVPGAPPLGGGGGDPHAGVPGAPPLGGGAPTGMNPHGAAGNPHGGGGGVDVTQLGLPPPDPSRPVDPDRYLEGIVQLGAAHAGKVPAGSIVYLSVKAADPATGNGVGMPVATAKLMVTGNWPMPFRLDQSNAMVGGTGFTGDVVVTARYDQDGEARSKQPGDIQGLVRTVIPAKKLVISLDQML